MKDQIRSDQSLSRVWLFATPWIAARQASLSMTNSWSSLRLMSIESQWTPWVGDGQRGLACCDSRGRKESDMTERLIWCEDRELVFFLCLWKSSFPSTIYRRDYPFFIEYSWLPHQILVSYICMSLFMGSLFCCILLCVCYYVSIIPSWLIWVCITHSLK